MKHVKKLFAFAVAVFMVLGIALPAFAATNDGSITIQNTVNGKTYDIYKVFDATYSGKNVAYTYTTSGEQDAFLTALQKNDSPFTVTPNTAGTYNVEKKDGKTDAEVLTFIKSQASNFGGAVASLTGDGGTKTANNLAYGYYYITTTTNSAVTIDSALPNATVIDKNESIPKPDKTETTGNYVDKKAATAKVGDTVTYKVTGKITRYQGEDLVTNLFFKDTMTAGLTPDRNVTISVKAPGAADFTSLTANEYTVKYSGQETTITVPTASVDDNGDITFNFETGTEYKITYTATVNEESIDIDEDNNTVEAFYNDNKEIGSDTTTIKNYEVTLTKVNGEGTKLAGAKFELYDARTNGNKINVVLVQSDNDPANYGTAKSPVNNVYRVAKASETGVEMVTGTTGIIEVKGLNNGSYYFEEKEAPEGYNVLTARTDPAAVNNADGAVEVTNLTGSIMPSTGGIGTTIFYVVGGVMVAGAVIFLLTKRRAASDAE